MVDDTADDPVLLHLPKLLDQHLLVHAFNAALDALHDVLKAVSR